MKEKTLFIVDVQKKYRQSFQTEYLNKLSDYLIKNHNKFNKIVCIMENNEILGDYIPEEIKNKLTIRPVFKCYDADYSYNKVKNSPNFKLTNKGLIPLIKIPEGDFFIKEGDGYILGTRDADKTFIDYMSKDLYYLMNLLRSTDIYIVGGGLNHCVKKTQNYFKFMGISSNILSDLCFTIAKVPKPCDIHRFNIFIENKQED